MPIHKTRAHDEWIQTVWKATAAPTGRAAAYMTRTSTATSTFTRYYTPIATPARAWYTFLARVHADVSYVHMYEPQHAHRDAWCDEKETMCGDGDACKNTCTQFTHTHV